MGIMFVCLYLQLVPPNRAKQQMLTVPGELSPVVGVSVVLRKEDMVSCLP